MVTPTPPHLRGLLIAQLWELGEVIRVGGDGDLDPIMLSLVLYDIHINTWTQSHWVYTQVSNIYYQQIY